MKILNKDVRLLDFWILTLFVCGLVYRVFLIFHESFGADEVFSLNMVNLSYHTLLFKAYDAHPQLFYILSKPITDLWPNKFLLYRFVSVIFSMLGIYASYKIFRQLLSPIYLIIFIAVVAFHPILLMQSYIFRGYSLYFSMIMLSFYNLEEWFRYEKISNAIGSIFFIWCALNSHFFSLLFFVFYGTFKLIYLMKNKKTLISFVKNIFVPLIILLTPYWIQLVGFLHFLSLGTESKLSSLSWIKQTIGFYFYIITGGYVRSLPDINHFYEFFDSLNKLQIIVMCIHCLYAVIIGLIFLFSLLNREYLKKNILYYWLFFGSFLILFIQHTRYFNSYSLPFLIPIFWFIILNYISQCKGDMFRKVLLIVIFLFSLHQIIVFLYSPKLIFDKDVATYLKQSDKKINFVYYVAHQPLEVDYYYNQPKNFFKYHGKDILQYYINKNGFYIFEIYKKDIIGSINNIRKLKVKSYNLYLLFPEKNFSLSPDDHHEEVTSLIIKSGYVLKEFKNIDPNHRYTIKIEKYVLP